MLKIGIIKRSQPAVLFQKWCGAFSPALLITMERLYYGK